MALVGVIHRARRVGTGPGHLETFRHPFQCMLRPSCKLTGLAESQVSAQAMFKATRTGSPLRAAQPRILPAVWQGRWQEQGSFSSLLAGCATLVYGGSVFMFSHAE